MPRVLIIDDETGIRSALQRWFARQGWSTVTAEDGEAGLASIRESLDDQPSRIDLVLCDLHLPKLSGLELHAVLRVERPELASRFIFSTGDAVADMSLEGVPLSPDHLLQKPFEFSALRAMIQSIVPGV